MEDLIDEGSVPSLLRELGEAALEAIDTHKYDNALEMLRKSSDIIEACISNGGSVDDFQMLVTMNNTAVCLQR